MGKFLNDRDVLEGQLQEAVDSWVLEDEEADIVVMAQYAEFKDNEDIQAFAL